MTWLSRFRKQRRLISTLEHVRLLEDQVASGEAGLVVYRGLAVRLQAELALLESPRSLLKGRDVYDY